MGSDAGTYTYSSVPLVALFPLIRQVMLALWARIGEESESGLETGVFLEESESVEMTESCRLVSRVRCRRHQ